jgi:hypothetical protein
MAEKDRSERRTEIAAYFIPKFATNYACFGKLGHHYSFTKENPIKVSLPCDIEFFRIKQDLIEVNELGKVEVVQSKIVSETAPPAPASSFDAGDKFIMKSDSIKELDEDEEAEIEIEKPKKKNLDKLSETKDKKKKKKKIELKDDWEEDSDN